MPHYKRLDFVRSLKSLSNVNYQAGFSDLAFVIIIFEFVTA